MGWGRVLTGEFKKESYPMEKTPVRTPSYVCRSDLPVQGCTPAKHTLGMTRRGFCTIFVQAPIRRYVPALSCTAGVRSESQASSLLFLCYARTSIRAACMHSYVQILSHSHIPGYPCVLLHSLPLSSFLTYIHTYTHQHASGLISQHHTCSLRLSG